MKKTIGIAALVLSCITSLFFTDMACYADEEKEDVVIVIDAGHGAHDPGSTATTGALEKDINLAIAKAMKSELEKYEGVQVYLTHSEDQWMSNTGRAMIAASLQADFLVSLHNNSGSETNSGAIVYRTLNEDYAQITNDLGNRIVENLSALGLNNGGVQTRESTKYPGDEYYTLIGEGVRAGIPSIIVEHCFLSNPSDAALISGSDGTVNMEMATKMGQADANAFVSYYGLKLRTVVADDKTTIKLEKDDRVTVEPDKTGTGELSWYAISDAVAGVDENGVVTAVGEGTTNIVYKYEDGTTGYVVVEVMKEYAVALTGGLDGTFYESSEEMSRIDKSDIFAFMTYSDGSSYKVQPETIGDIDSSKTGFQDIEITYGDLKGSLRLCLEASGFVPEKYVPVPVYEMPTRAEEVSPAEDKTQENDSKSQNSEKKIEFKDILVYVVVLAAVIVVGIILFFIEHSRKRRRRRRNRRRRRY